MACATPPRTHPAECVDAPEKCAGTRREMTEATPRLAHDAEKQAQKSRQISIVLTGGPCSGKSSVLAFIRERLGKRGIQVITVPEYATHFFANSDGFQGEWVGTEKEEDLQHTLLRYQMMQEDMFQDYANLNSKTSVLLLDRGTLDQKVFTSSEDIWFSCLKRNGLTEDMLLDRYDMIMHLSTCALVGNYEWGPDSNNPGRYHNPEEAARLDGVFTEVYKSHRQFRSVPHCDKFGDKVDLVLKYLEDALGVDGLVGARQRTGVAVVDAIPADVLRTSQAFAMTSTYLDEAMQLSVRRMMKTTADTWMRGIADTNMSFAAISTGSRADIQQTFEERRSIPEESTLARRSIPEDTYHNAVRLATHPSIHKHVLSFQDEDGSHHELFYFQGGARNLILDDPVGRQLPSWLQLQVQAEAKVESVLDPVNPRRSRILKAHSTEEESEAHRLGWRGAV